MRSTCSSDWRCSRIRFAMWPVERCRSLLERMGWLPLVFLVYWAVRLFGASRPSPDLKSPSSQSALPGALPPLLLACLLRAKLERRILAASRSRQRRRKVDPRLTSGWIRSPEKQSETAKVRVIDCPILPSHATQEVTQWGKKAAHNPMDRRTHHPDSSRQPLAESIPSASPEAGRFRHPSGRVLGRTTHSRGLENRQVLLEQHPHRRPSICASCPRRQPGSRALGGHAPCDRHPDSRHMGRGLESDSSRPRSRDPASDPRAGGCRSRVRRLRGAVERHQPDELAK